MKEDGFILHEWEKEKMDKMVQDNFIKLAEKRGNESKTIEMIQNMLKKNADYNYFSEISGKTIEEIKEIEESIKEEK